MYRSLMIATGPANDKIYDRCIRLLTENTATTSAVEAEEALIKSIYSVDEIPDEIRRKTKNDHIKASLLPIERRDEAQLILPVAFLLASKVSGENGALLTVEAAKAAALAEPRIDTLLRNVLGSSNSHPIPVSTNLQSQAVGSSVNTSVQESSRYVIGIDLGGTYVRCSAVNPTNGQLFGKFHKMRVQHASPDEVLKLMCDACKDIIAEQHASPTGINIGQPGFVCPDGSIKNMANFPHWTEPVPVKQYLMTHIGCIVNVYDDADSALMGEVKYGAGRLMRNVAMLTIGTGTGSSVSSLRNGRCGIYKGTRGLIECGHSIVNTKSNLETIPRCTCGQHGCLELYASASGIVRMAQEKKLTSDTGIDTPTVEEIFSLYHAKNTIAVEIVKEMVHYICIGIINMIRSYDPDVVIIGGKYTLGVGLCDDSDVDIVDMDYSSLFTVLYDQMLYIYLL